LKKLQSHHSRSKMSAHPKKYGHISRFLNRQPNYAGTASSSAGEYEHS